VARTGWFPKPSSSITQRLKRRISSGARHADGLHNPLPRPPRCFRTVMNDHVARTFVHGLARVRDKRNPADDLAHLWVAFHTLPGGVGPDDTCEVAMPSMTGMMPDCSGETSRTTACTGHPTHHCKVLAHDLFAHARASSTGTEYSCRRSARA